MVNELPLEDHPLPGGAILRKCIFWSEWHNGSSI